MSLEYDSEGGPDLLGVIVEWSSSVESGLELDCSFGKRAEGS